MWLIKKILFPFSLIYGVVVYVRNRCYDLRIFSSKSFNTPLICVGNLSTGGTGKTPMVEFLIEILQKENKVAVLSRGYKRKSNGFVLANALSTAEDLGDEPFQIFSKFTDITVAVDADRVNGIQRLNKEVQPDVIILDDAFQHRKVKPKYSILLTASGDLYCDDWYLPTGNLRDSIREAQRADLIIVTKNSPDIRKEHRKQITQKLKPQADQLVLFSFLQYDLTLYGTGKFKNIAELKNEKVTLVTGIANPKPLLQFLNSQGVIFEHLAFSDHHFFKKGEIEMLRQKPNLLTTEKDFVRLKDAISDISFIRIKHQFFEDGLEKITDELKKLMS